MRRFLKIIGDHSRYHVGGAAVFVGLAAVARQNGWTIARDGAPYDALVVNGEGTMHHGSLGFHRKMKLLRHAVEAGKPAYLVNSVWQSNPSDYDDTLRALSGIVVREVFNKNDLLERHGIEAAVVPDVSMVAPLRTVFFRKNFRSKPAMTDFYFPDRKLFTRANEMFPFAEYLRFRKLTSWSRAVASLRTAEYLITGRQHGVYAACKARIPFAASEGNTHKIKGLIATARVDIPVADHPSGIKDIIPLIPSLKAEYGKLFDWLESQDYASIMPHASAPPEFPSR